MQNISPLWEICYFWCFKRWLKTCCLAETVMLSRWEPLRAQTHWKGIIICDCACTSCYEILKMKLFPIIMPSRHGTYCLSACPETLVSSDWPSRTAKKTNRRYNSQLHSTHKNNNNSKRSEEKAWKEIVRGEVWLTLFVLRESRNKATCAPRFREPHISLFGK